MTTLGSDDDRLVRLAFENFASEIACIEGDRYFTFAELDAAVDLVSGRLLEQGVAAGDRIALVPGQKWATLVMLWSLLRAGAVTCLLSPRLPEGARRQTLTQVGAKQLFDEPAIEEKGVGSLFRPSDLGGGARVGRKRLPTPFSSWRDDHVATIVFSSGTTGAAKAIAHDLRAHVASALGSNENLALGPGDRWLWSLPAYHVGGLAILFRCLLAGAAVVTDTGADTLVEDLSRYSITHVSMVTTQLKRLLAHGAFSPTPLQAVLLGGSALPPSLIQAAYHAGVPLRTTYGLSEAASQVTATPADCPGQKRCTAGRVLARREVKISAEGEILVRGETLCRGYYRDGIVEPVVDAEGWFHTGDLGTLDDDGYLTVTGRLDNMFISGGENIHPEEIESHLLSIKGIRNAIVVPVDDDEYGRRPVAFLDVDQIDAALLDAHLLGVLPKFKLPIAYYHWPTCDEHAEMKPRRADLRAIVAKTSSGRHHVWPPGVSD
jgi:O-succinylbenzoic acid--CoA ligase